MWYHYTFVITSWALRAVEDNGIAVRTCEETGIFCVGNLGRSVEKSVNSLLVYVRAAPCSFYGISPSDVFYRVCSLMYLYGSHILSIRIEVSYFLPAQKCWREAVCCSLLQKFWNKTIRKYITQLGFAHGPWNWERNCRQPDFTFMVVFCNRLNFLNNVLLISAQ